MSVVRSGLLWLRLLGAICIAPLGCGGATVESVCETLFALACTAESTEFDQAACEDQGNADREQANLLGCVSEYDSFLACQENTLACESGVPVIDCDAQIKALERCFVGEGLEQAQG